MSDRDLFAAAAMTALLAKSGKYTDSSLGELAQLSYRVADQMVARQHPAVAPPPPATAA